MANMSYCRMENTYKDLRDVYDNWEESERESELKYRDLILELSRKIIMAYDEEGEYTKFEEEEN